MRISSWFPPDGALFFFGMVLIWVHLDWDDSGYISSPRSRYFVSGDWFLFSFWNGGPARRGRRSRPDGVARMAHRPTCPKKPQLSGLMAQPWAQPWLPWPVKFKVWPTFLQVAPSRFGSFRHAGFIPLWGRNSFILASKSFPQVAVFSLVVFC